MAYNLSERHKVRASARDTAIKLKQENELAKSIMAGYFLPISRDLQKSYSQTGSTPPLFEHDMNLTKILNSNYASTSDKFISQVRDGLGEPLDANTLDEQIDIQSATQQVLDITQTKKSISETTQENLDKIIKDIIIAAAAAGMALSDKQVAREAKNKFVSDSQGRTPTIGLTQTQQAAEGAKHSELAVLMRNGAIFPKAGVDLSKDIVQKTWVPILDSRTREAHAEADLQTVDFDEAYIVGGQRLMYPGDTSLGATLDNTINCRCASVKSIKKVQ